MCNPVLNSEYVARILRKDWLEDGKLVHTAFALRYGESYVSVNRLAIPSFEMDVRDFIGLHPDYDFGNGKSKYATLNVGDVRDIKVELEGVTVNMDVEVEPRDLHVKSHAGIFTRIGNRNIKPGGSFVTDDPEACYSSDALLLKVRLQLLRMAKY